MPKTGKLQTIIVYPKSKRGFATRASMEKAEKLVKDTVPDAATNLIDVRSNGTYRFRQLGPWRFVPGTWRTKRIERTGGTVDLVYGTLKPKKKAKK